MCRACTVSNPIYNMWCIFAPFFSDIHFVQCYEWENLLRMTLKRLSWGWGVFGTYRFQELTNPAKACSSERKGVLCRLNDCGLFPRSNDTEVRSKYRWEVSWQNLLLSLDGKSIGLLWTRWWTFGFHNMLGSSWVAARLAASQEGLSSVNK
jgi:hypothetical protein